MPQKDALDVPLEASETLAFTPQSLREIEGAPTFFLRTATHREKRFHQLMLDEEQLHVFDAHAFRKELLAGFREGWESEDFEHTEQILKDYWSARDDFDLQKADRDKEIADARAQKEAGEEVDIPPELEFEYDKQTERFCKDLIAEIGESHRPIGRMMAANRKFEQTVGAVTVAVFVKSWSGLEVQRSLARGYVTLDCAFEIRDALEDFEEEHGLEVGNAWRELEAMCSIRRFLSEDAAKNFASPSSSSTPSEKDQPSSKTGNPGRGKSKASASSKKTRQSA